MKKKFKFKHRLDTDPSLIYTAQVSSVFLDKPIVMVMWQNNGELSGLSFSEETARKNIEGGHWLIIEEE